MTDMTLADFFEQRAGRRYGARKLAEQELSISHKQWSQQSDKSIESLGPIWAYALAALQFNLKPLYTLDAKKKIIQHSLYMVEAYCFAAVNAGLPPYWGPDN